MWPEAMSSSRGWVSPRLWQARNRRGTEIAAAARLLPGRPSTLVGETQSFFRAWSLVVVSAVPDVAVAAATVIAVVATAVRSTLTSMPLVGVEALARRACARPPVLPQLLPQALCGVQPSGRASSRRTPYTCSHPHPHPRRCRIGLVSLRTARHSPPGRRASTRIAGGGVSPTARARTPRGSRRRRRRSRPTRRTRCRTGRFGSPSSRR